VTGSGSGNSNFFNTLVVNELQTDLVGLAIPALLWRRRNS
jgi:hypothetical protein